MRTAQVEAQLYASIQAKCNELRCNIISLGGIEDHIHLLVRFPTTFCVADFVKEVKGSSSHLMTHEVSPKEFFKWQGAYGAFTVSPGMIEKVSAYILNQKAHHGSKDLVDDWEKCETEDEQR